MNRTSKILITFATLASTVGLGGTASAQTVRQERVRHEMVSGTQPHVAQVRSEELRRMIAAERVRSEHRRRLIAAERVRSEERRRLIAAERVRSEERRGMVAAGEVRARHRADLRNAQRERDHPRQDRPGHRVGG
jgi:hypothetical protein